MAKQERKMLKPRIVMEKISMLSLVTSQGEERSRWKRGAGAIYGLFICTFLPIAPPSLYRAGKPARTKNFLIAWT